MCLLGALASADDELAAGSDQVRGSRHAGPEDAATVDLRFIQRVFSPLLGHLLQPHGELHVSLAENAHYAVAGKLHLIVAAPLNQSRDLLGRIPKGLLVHLARDAALSGSADQGSGARVKEPHGDAGLFPRIVLCVSDAKRRFLQVNFTPQVELCHNDEGQGPNVRRQGQGWIWQVRHVFRLRGERPCGGAAERGSDRSSIPGACAIPRRQAA
mmetsp:Transcript_43198/g.94166  ORF Transcript_43198/g.94166 Transcript_43198/m.94166 type:complete len:213 (-) Transcript_43198:256-894(-)